MSLYLSTTSLVGPTLPSILEETCQRLIDNDPSLLTLELIHPRIDDVFARVVAEALDENHTVTSFVLSCFSIVDDGAYAIGSVLGSSKKIQKLQLRDLRDSREVITFFQSLQQNSSLEEISLRHSQINSKSASSISKFLSLHTKLKEVRLVDCQLLENSLELICEGLKNNKTVQRLYLVNTEIYSQHAVHLANMLQYGAVCLRELHLGENELGDDGVAVLTTGLLKNKSVRLLDLRSNGISAEGCLSLQGLIVSSQYLESLRLANNEIGNFGVSALARGLQGPDSVLQKLDLSATGIDHDGSSAIATMLLRTNGSKHNPCLRELNLALNSVGDVGAAAISKALVRNSTLTWLCLRRNGITNIGALAFAKAIPKMSGLKELMLTRNRIDQEGAAALLQGLRGNVELEYLLVEDKVSDPISKEIFHWIRLNKAGRRLFRQPKIPITLWPHVYSRFSADVDVLYYFLKEKPEFFSNRSCEISKR
jgi:Ran GTPase-activating protein (RanGAP) involved in mRNA processing and transport